MPELEIIQIMASGKPRCRYKKVMSRWLEKQCEKLRGHKGEHDPYWVTNSNEE